MNIEEKIDTIISDLNFIKTNYNRALLLTDFCQSFRLALISKLEQFGAQYDPTLEHERSATGNNTTDKKRFFAFKRTDSFSELEILGKLEDVYEVCTEYMSQFGDLKNLSFNIQKIESLRDKYSFSDLIRGILVVKEVDNAR